jgi:hypothetical protein
LPDWPRSKKVKAETGKRKAKTRGVKKEGREEQEDEEGKKLPLTAAGVQGLHEKYTHSQNFGFPLEFRLPGE